MYGTANIGDINGGHIGGFRNLLFNARGLVNQREYVSATATSGAKEYTLDRWRVETSGEALSFSEANGYATMTAPTNGVVQVVEGDNLITGTYTVNWTGTATCKVNGTTRAKGESFSLTGGVDVTVGFFGGTFALPQFEQGDSPTKFEVVSKSVDEMRCRRYYVGWNLAANKGPISAQHESTGSGVGSSVTVIFAPPMRAEPDVAGTFTAYSGGSLSGAALVAAGPVSTHTARFAALNQYGATLDVMSADAEIYS